MSLSSFTTSTPLGAKTDLKARCEGEKEKERDTEREFACLFTKSGLTPGSRNLGKAQCVGAFLIVSTHSSESAGVDNTNNYNVSNGGNYCNPEPDGIAGHGLRLIWLSVH